MGATDRHHGFARIWRDGDIEGEANPTPGPVHREGNAVFPNSRGIPIDLRRWGNIEDHGLFILGLVIVRTSEVPRVIISGTEFPRMDRTRELRRPPRIGNE